VHYRADLKTSPELDAITAQVVADLAHLQRKRQSDRPAQTLDTAEIEIELIRSLKEMLSRLFRPDKLAITVERKLSEASKRFARLFFTSELHDRIRGSASEQKMMRYGEQALYHVLTRGENELFKALAQFEYESPRVREKAKSLLAEFTKELRNEYLSRTTPELNALVRHLNEVLQTFFLSELPPMLGELAWQVVKEARLAIHVLGARGKLSDRAFPHFRQSFEKRFLERLVPFVEDEMLRHVRGSEGKFRIETIRFVADPHIFSDVCELVCDAIYDFLHTDGFLDLPLDWRARLAGSPG
jgi:hypothetical protein